MPASDGGSVLGWGYGNLQQTAVPASLDGKAVVAISAGLNHSLALTSAGEVVGWGYDPSGQASPPSSLNGKTVVAIAAGVPLPRRDQRRPGGRLG